QRWDRVGSHGSFFWTVSGVPDAPSWYQQCSAPAHARTGECAGAHGSGAPTELAPQMGGALGALEQQGYLDFLVGRVDPVLVEADGDEDERGVEDLGDVGLGAAASLSGEEDLLVEGLFHGGA